MNLKNKSKEEIKEFIAMSFDFYTQGSKNCLDNVEEVIIKSEEQGKSPELILNRIIELLIGKRNNIQEAEEVKKEALEVISDMLYTLSLLDLSDEQMEGLQNIFKNPLNTFKNPPNFKGGI